jgi:Flp pilus assembly pilin Flp
MLNYINRALVGLRTDEDGQTYVEYALMLSAVVAVALAATWTGLGTSITNAVTQVSNAIGA